MKIFCCLVLLVLSASWQDHPDKEDHKDTDRLFKLAQMQTGTDVYEKDIVIKADKKRLKDFKTSKHKVKFTEESFYERD
jgi:hypothetical protein